MITKRVLGGFLVGMLLLAGPGLAQGAVELPPAEAEVAALEDAFAQLTGFFRGLIIEIKGSLTMLSERVQTLERTALVLKMGLEEMAGQFTKFERAVVPTIMALDGRISALEKHDFASLERRLAALDKATEALLVKIDNNRAKIEALEAVLAAVGAATEERLAVVVAEVQDGIATQSQEIDTLKSELARLAQQQQAQWSAIFLVPIVVGGLLYLLLSQG